MRNIKINLILFFQIVAIFEITAARIDTLFVYSSAMDKNTPNLVILPDSYSGQQSSFPALYLLHGAGGDYLDWNSRVPNIQAYANQHDIIIICPDGSSTSWYFDSPVDKKCTIKLILVQS